MAKKKKVKKVIEKYLEKGAALAVVPEKVKPESQANDKYRVTKEMIDDYLFGSGTKLNEQQKILFSQTALALNLNPFKKEIYPIPFEEKRWDYNKKQSVSYEPPRYRMSLITGYEVYLKRAERSGKVQGWKTWTEGQGTGIKACIEIHRRDWKEPLYHEVFMAEYKQTNSMWDKKPITMLKKVAIAQGFRLAFPDEIGGLPYSSEESSEEILVETAEYIPAPASKQIEEPKEKEIKYTLPKNLTPESICDLGVYSKKPKAYKDIPLDKLLMLWEKTKNPSELDGVLSWVIRANMEVKLSGKKYDWDKFNLLDITDKLAEYVKIAGVKNGRA